jgi:Na+/H+-dicarboxylate symporter
VHAVVGGVVMVTLMSLIVVLLGRCVVVLLALVLGTGLRRLHVRAARTGADDHAIVRAVEWIYEWLVRILGWIIHLVPLAVFGVVAQVVGKSGVGVFSILWIFLVAMLAGLTIHALIYYPLVAWFVGKKSPKVYLGEGADAIMTAMSCNSSLATVPVTLHCLNRMNVSAQSSRLAACVGTNLNNDGITLYEAMAARDYKLKEAVAAVKPATSTVSEHP